MRGQSNTNFNNETSSLLVDRRKQVRIQIHMKASIAGDNQVFHDSTIIDISNDGAQIQSYDTCPEENKCLTVKFKLGTEYLLSAAIVWFRGVKNKNYFIGVKWVNLTHSEKERLEREIMRIAVNRRRLKK